MIFWGNLITSLQKLIRGQYSYTHNAFGKIDYKYISPPLISDMNLVASKPEIYMYILQMPQFRLTLIYNDKKRKSLCIGCITSIY